MKSHSFFTSQWYGILCIIISATSFGTLGLFGTRVQQAGVSTENMLFWRYFLSTLFLCVLCLFAKNRFFVLKDLFLFFLSGAVFLGISSLCYFISAQDLGTGIAMVLFYIFPAFIAIFSHITGSERLTLTKIFCIALCFLGCVLLVDMQGRVDFSWGAVGLAILAASTYAVYFFLGGKVKQGSAPLLATTVVSIGCSLFFFVLSISNNAFILPRTFALWNDLLLLSLFGSLLPMLTLFEGLKYVSPFKASLLSSVEPIVTLILGFIFLEEQATELQILGVIIILASIVLIQKEKEIPKKIH